MRCGRAVRLLVRELMWWDFYPVCDLHEEWSRNQFLDGHQLIELAVPTSGQDYDQNRYPDGCIYDPDLTPEDWAARRARMYAP